RGNKKKTEIERRLAKIKKMFGLTENEMEVLTLLYFVKGGGIINELLRARSFDLTNMTVARSRCHVPLGLDVDDVNKVFTKGSLFTHSLLKRGHGNTLSLSDWCVDYLDCIGEADPSNRISTMNNLSSLEL